jgi:inorganic pyrophosphatase
MTMLDEGKRDHKIIAVAVEDPEYNHYTDVDQLPPHRVKQIRRFFEDYKIMENKAVAVDEIQPAGASYQVIEDALSRYSRHRRGGFAYGK